KSVEQMHAEHQGGELKKSLGALNLVLLGIGCIIGAGIYVMTGNAAANYAGPSVMLSFIIAGTACGFAGLCYAELASTMPVAGSAYTYSYATMGELIAWIMGWLLVLEYGVAAATVAAGWSGYVTSLLKDFGVLIPAELSHSMIQSTADATGHLIFQVTNNFNLVGTAGMLLVTGLLVLGVSESATVNNVIVFIKVGVLLAFIIMGVGFIQPENWTPFIPPNQGGFVYGVQGVFRAASVIFFAYVGFEAVSTAAAEAKNPSRDMPIGILGSLFVCTAIYIAVAAVLTGVVSYKDLGVPEPIAVAVDRMGMPWFSFLIKVGAVAGLSSVMLILTYGQSRIFYSMARDGLLPKAFAIIHPRFRTPWIGTIVLGALIAIAASLLPISILGDLVSLGTSFAFGIVCLTVMYLRSNRPDLHRPFRVPLGGVFVSARLRVVISTVMAFVGLAVFRFLMQSPWTDYGAVVVLIVAAIWLVRSWRDTTGRYWLGTAPMLGILFAVIMAAPLIEDIITKAMADDPIPAIILTSYLVLGAAIYLFYGLKNSRLAQGLDILDDQALPGPLEAALHGVDERR
ncbi:MAG: amino acid permease, partial [Rhodospirillaceae bacterium]|nr:amino acid permease [Rhodospirillaceae bacterium]